RIKLSNATRNLISTAVTISDHKIKTKNNKTLIEALIETFSKIFNKSHMTSNNHSDKIKIGQNSVFSSANTIITKKTIFVLNAVFQIIQLKIVNSFLISIKHLQKTIKSNHSHIKHEQESTLEFRFYTLITLAITIKTITMFI